MIEVVWFIARPVVVELAYVWSQRSRVRVMVRSFLMLTVIAGLGIWMFPVATEVEAPAMIHSAGEYSIYAPFPARLDEVLVRSGQAVHPDTVVARLDAPEVRDRAVRAAMQARAYAAELARAPASTLQQERIRVLEQQLSEAVAQYRGAVADMHRLELRASIAGVVRDLSPDLTPGRWVQPRQVMLRVVEPSRSMIDAYVAENQLRAVQIGQTVRFYPDASNLPVVTGKVQVVEPVAIKIVPHPLLSSTNGGPLPASRSEHGGTLIPHQAMYRVRIQPDAEGGFRSVVRGSVRIQTGFFALAENFIARAIALAIRESGF
jgi:putative peptide zinc metalloprotease protein